jgi:hypothetical protein
LLGFTIYIFFNQVGSLNLLSFDWISFFMLEKKLTRRKSSCALHAFTGSTISRGLLFLFFPGNSWSVHLGLFKPKIWQILRHPCPLSICFELFIVCFAMIKLLQWLSSHKTVCRVVRITELRLRSLSFLFHISCLFKILRLVA